MPGLGETLRVNGRCRLSTDADLLGRLAQGDRRPPLALVVEVIEVYIHCAKALMRSQLRDPDALHQAPALVTRAAG